MKRRGPVGELPTNSEFRSACLPLGALSKNFVPKIRRYCVLLRYMTPITIGFILFLSSSSCATSSTFVSRKKKNSFRMNNSKHFSLPHSFRFQSGSCHVCTRCAIHRAVRRVYLKSQGQEDQPGRRQRSPCDIDPREGGTCSQFDEFCYWSF